MSLVILAQAVFLHDGALVALGANIINMALIPAALVAWLQACKTAKAWSLGVVAAVSVLAAVGLIVVEVTAFRGPGFGLLLGAFAKEMFFNHLWVGLGEGVITLGILSAVSALNEKPIGRYLFTWPAGAALAGLVLALTSPWLGSSVPDGYEAAMHASGLEAKVAAVPAAFKPE